MIALMESTETSEIKIISAKDDDRLRNQIERVLESKLSASAWAKLYVDMDCVDLGFYSVQLFDMDSVLDIKPLPNPPVHVRVHRDSHNLKPL